ncbi:hypothetical protein D3C86_1259440 [compost metagenome]
MPGFADARPLRHHAGQCLIEQKPVARGLVQRDVILLIKLVPGHATAPGQWVIAPTGDHVAFLHQRLEIDFGLQRAHEAQAEIGFAIDHRAQHFMGAGIQHLDLDPRKLPVIVRDDSRHEVVRRRRHAGDSDVAKSGRSDFADAQQRHIQIVEQAFNAGHETAPGLGQADLAGGAFEQPDTERVFELFDAPAQGWLGDAYRVGSLAKAALLHHGAKSLQIVEVEIDGHGVNSALGSD